MYASRAGESSVDEDAPWQFSLDIDVELLHIGRRIGSVGSLKGVSTGVKSRNIARPGERCIETRTERPVDWAIQRAGTIVVTTCRRQRARGRGSAICGRDPQRGGRV